jgi:hypothetical protein
MAALGRLPRHLASGWSSTTVPSGAVKASPKSTLSLGVPPLPARVFLTRSPLARGEDQYLGPEEVVDELQHRGNARDYD